MAMVAGLISSCLPCMYAQDVMKGYKVSAFGDWNFYDQKPIAQGLQSIMDADFVQAHFFVGDGEDLFKVLSPYGHQPKKTRKRRGIEGEGKKYYYEEKRRKPKAVDEDLYKIPPELLYQIPKKKKLLWKFWAGCLCLNCIA
ncbi:hypothetical protein MUK42_04706 [Musa troglodytarum]|uniref:Uncharacterized protein n=1 Tax=Musa troglodytarum TaxID=320322 RepID=A0A9E7IIK7_9LILI|nr:hypothetical protein MUK42_04706 [Musa troglodytarum]